MRCKNELIFKPELYLKTNGEPASFSMKKEPLSKIEFESMKEADEFIENYKHVEGFKIYGMTDWVLQFINRSYKEKIEFDPELIHGGIIDIEVFSGKIETGQVKKGPFPDASLALYPIVSITIYHTYLKRFFTFALEYFQDIHVGSFKNSREDVIYKGFQTEHELLTAVSLWWEGQDFNYYSGWNSETFDITYLVNRMKNICGEESVKRLSPWGIVKPRTFKTTWGEQTTYDLIGCPCLDYLELVKKHGYVTLPDWKLDTAAEHFLKEKKIDYSEVGDLNTLYFVNFQKYIEYNINDVGLIVRMEEKQRFLNLTFTLAYLMHCNYEDTLGTVMPWRSYAYFRLIGKGIQPEVKSIYQGEIKFPGGFVLDPKPGRYKWVVSIDAKSEYPHMGMQYNLGPETYIEPKEAYKIRQLLVEELYDAISKEYDFEKRKHLTELKDHIYENKMIHEFYWKYPYKFKTLKELNICMAPNLSFYKNGDKSLWHEIFEDIYYNMRNATKAEMLNTEQELVNLKAKVDYDKNEVERLEIQITNLNTLQIGYKIAMNSAYGALSNRYFSEYFNLDIAAAITTSGQTGIRFIGRKLDEYFNQVCGTKNHQFVIGQDTDSCYVCLDILVDKLCKGKTDDEIVDFLDKVFKTKIEKLVLDWAEELSDALGCTQNRLIFKREVIATVGVWAAKKRYAMLVKDKEGVRYDEPKLKVIGLDSVRSTYPKHCRKWLDECYELVLKYNDESMIHNKIKEIEKEFNKKPIQEIATASSITDLDKFLSHDEKLWIKGTPMHVKAAIGYNQVIKKLGIQEPPIQSGDKLLYVSLKERNPYSLDVLGFQGIPPKELDLDKWVNRRSTFEKTFISPLQIFLDAVGFNHEPRANVMDFFV